MAQGRALSRHRGSFGPTAGTAGAPSPGAQARPRCPHGTHVHRGSPSPEPGFLPPPPPPRPPVFPPLFRRPRGRRPPSCPVSCPRGLPQPLCLLPGPASTPHTSILPRTECSRHSPPRQRRPSSPLLFPDPCTGGGHGFEAVVPKSCAFLGGSGPQPLCGTWSRCHRGSEPARSGDFGEGGGSAFHQPFSSGSAIKVSNGASLPPHHHPGARTRGSGNSPTAITFGDLPLT